MLANCATRNLGFDLPSLAPGVGGKDPFLPVALCVLVRNSVDRGLVCGSLGGENASPTGIRWRGLERPDLTPPGAFAAAALRRSSVAFSLASRASSSEVWEETARFLGIV